MIEIAKIVGCGVIYFLVIYLVMIRREAQPIVPWTVCIASQVICAVFFNNITAFFKSLLPVEQYGNLGMVIPSGILCLGNVALIFIMFGAHMSKARGLNSAQNRRNEEFRIAPLPSVINNMRAGQSAEENTRREEGLTIAFIRNMIADGRREEAIRYLTMLAYYGKDDESRAEASRLIEDLYRTGE